MGYTGGTTVNPSYKDVCTGNTGHAEAVEVHYNPEHISYEKLLDCFFEIHNPTALNRQGPDIGTQYRSVIFYTNEHQKKVSTNYIKKLQGSFSDPIVTKIEAEKPFYKAEEYHQKYLEKRRLSS